MTSGGEHKQPADARHLDVTTPGDHVAAMRNQKSKAEPAPGAPDETVKMTVTMLRSTRDKFTVKAAERSKASLVTVTAAAVIREIVEREGAKL